MKLKDWLQLVACKTTWDHGMGGGPSGIYKSKFDDSYITLVGLEENMEFLATREVTEELTHGVGFSPKDNKWYGWSHRAIYGFTIGSTCKKGDCHYTATTPEELIDDHVAFYDDVSPEDRELRRAECQILEDRSGIRILPAPVILPIAENLNEAMAVIDEGIDLPTEDISRVHEIKCGKGEWTAKTMEDAKQMAIDFNRGVS